ncbi:MAG: GIY-YIG nuclease family protein [Candidatus Pacebacteria bacterium]|nr:GIY-YIG nuclease family protein [Candidatus Paceibacterota bacterium]
MYFIYRITCKENNKVYIGKTTTSISQRWNRHLRDSFNLDTHLARAIKLYGESAFSIEEVEQIEPNKGLDYLSEREQWWIKHYDSYYSGYNETIGGDGGNTYQKKNSQEMEVIKNKIRQTKIGGNNPQAKKIKCKNIKTNEEFHFNSLSECQIFLNETNHQFISRRLLGSTKTLWKETWAFAYENKEYPTFYETQKNFNSRKIEVIDLLENLEPKIFMSFAAAERFYNMPNKSFALSRQKDQTKNKYIVKNRFQITILE